MESTQINRLRLTLKKLKFLFLVASLFYFESSNCQNLVDNPSFENYSECPSDNTFYATGWYRVAHHNGTVDYLNTCAPFSYVSIPANRFGTQEPYDGNAYIGLVFLNPVSTYREYIQTNLLSPLVAGQFYKVSFLVSLTDSSTHAMNNIGAVLTNEPIIGNDDMEQLVINPQINSSLIIRDKINWVEVSGVFKAEGGEEFLTLGNFHSNEETSKEIVMNSAQKTSYHLVDFVQVVQTDAPRT
ncbi:MAG: hypothetical protein M0D53_01840 [Flavobacterium sp. JAD_PAG50586_2]|nr:MAG: hypothetical protein M0D53_01840 [Flavobacterium sp. JAD_PAG50586_2]